MFRGHAASSAVAAIGEGCDQQPWAAAAANAAQLARSQPNCRPFAVPLQSRYCGSRRALPQPRCQTEGPGTSRHVGVSQLVPEPESGKEPPLLKRGAANLLKEGC